MDLQGFSATQLSQPWRSSTKLVGLKHIPLHGSFPARASRATVLHPPIVSHYLCADQTRVKDLGRSLLAARATSPSTEDLLKAAIRRSEGDQFKGNAERYKIEKRFTGTDVALGAVHVFGWSVEIKGKGELGKVIEILHVGRASSQIHEDSAYGYVLKVFQPFVQDTWGAHREFDIISRLEHSFNVDKHCTSAGIEILIPIVDEFFQCVDAERRRLVLKPPEGLLELAGRPEALRRLRPDIRQFCQRYADFLQERFPGNKKIKFDSNVDLQQIVQVYMPTRDQLHAVGRSDLVRQIRAAGGFLFVAQALGLKSTRRPNGFWDDLEKLDIEIEQFVWENWVKKVHEETGMIYFENDVTKQVCIEEPVRPKLFYAGGQGLKVMPQQKALWRARRWDLHHAIIWNGGYTEVAHALGRILIRTSGKFRRQQMNAIRLLAADYVSSRQNNPSKAHAEHADQSLL